MSLSSPTAATCIQAVLFISACWIFKRLATWIWRRSTSKSPFRDLPGPQPASWTMGNLVQLFNAKGLPFHQSLVDMYGGMVKVYGFFGDEQLFVADPIALHTIISKEQDAFGPMAALTESSKVIFGPGLISVTGSQHERKRRVVNPIFAVGHLRRLVPTFYHIADKLADVMASEVSDAHDPDQVSGSPKKVLDMSAWMCRVSLESIGRTVVGYSFDPLDSPHNNPYTSAIKDLIPALFSLSLVRQFAPYLPKLGPPSFRRKIVEWIPHKTVQDIKNMSDVMHETATEILQSKREAIAREDSLFANEKDTEEIPAGKDIISILLRANEQAKLNGGEQLSDVELTGQMTELIFAAQDTTSSTLSRMLHELSLHHDIQDRLRAEILEAQRQHSGVGNDGHLDYDTIHHLPWLDAVLKETLRLYPPAPFTRRCAARDVIVPYTRVNLDGESDISSVTVPAGTTVTISIIGANRLESVWGPDAKAWNPKRWLNDNQDGSNSQSKLPGVYSGMLSFLGGPRSCVGYRFALLEMKILLATLISRFSFSRTQDEVVWNLSQIIAPSVRTQSKTGEVSEEKGLPLMVEVL